MEEEARVFFQRRYGSKLHRVFSRGFHWRPEEREQAAELFADMSIGLLKLVELVRRHIDSMYDVESVVDYDRVLTYMKEIDSTNREELSMLYMFSRVGRNMLPCYIGLHYLMRMCEASEYIKNWTTNLLAFDFKKYDAVCLLLTGCLDAGVPLEASPGKLEENWKQSKDHVAEILRTHSQPFMFKTLRAVSRLGISLIAHDQPTWSEEVTTSTISTSTSTMKDCFELTLLTMGVNYAYEVLYDVDCSDVLHQIAFGKSVIEVKNIDEYCSHVGTYSPSPADLLVEHMNKYCLTFEEATSTSTSTTSSTTSSTSTSTSPFAPMYDHLYTMESRWCQAITRDAERIVHRLFRSTDPDFWRRHGYYMLRSLLVYFNKVDELGHAEIFPGILACLVELKLIDPFLAVAAHRAGRIVYARIHMRVKIDMYLVYVQRKLENEALAAMTDSTGPACLKRRDLFRRGLRNILKVAEVLPLKALETRTRLLLSQI